MTRYESVGIHVPEILLPKAGTGLATWAVVACDQYTSQPEYWEKADRLVGDAPSTLRLILPEAHLEAPDVADRIGRIHGAMRTYLDRGLFESRPGFVYVERTVGGRTRRGLVLALDLERYDYTRGSTSLIRATEGTILERIPPRLKIRDGAPLETPHILVLIDDPERTVIEPVAAAPGALERLYDVELMMGGGRVAGYRVPADAERRAVQALERLAEPARFAARYGLDAGRPVLLFAMGDGNHSFATAKAWWEKIKARVGPDHPARYALVEIGNVHDPALVFEPIHRVLFGVRGDLLAELRRALGAGVEIDDVPDAAQMAARIGRTAPGGQRFGVVTPDRFRVVTVARPPTTLAVGTVQAVLDPFLAAKGAERIDYVHGMDVVVELGRKPGNLGIFLPAMDKSDLFKTVILDGALPRKTFSMGEAHEKRFYLECRKIV
jgi:hypothetical protein